MAGENLLLDIPPELVNGITDNVSSKDLLALRSVCKEVAERTEAAMLKANFAHIRLLFSVPASLQRGLDIASHPTLKRGVQKISVYPNRFLKNGGPARLRLTDLRPSSTREERREVRCRQWAIYHTLADAQSKLIASGEDEAYVTEILRQLSGGRNLDVEIAELDIHVDPQQRHYARFARSGLKEFDKLAESYDGDLVVDGGPYHRPLLSVLRAVKLAGISLRSFGAGGQTQQVPISLFNDREAFRSMRQNFSKLTSLKLYLESCPSRLSNQMLHLAQEVDISAFIAFLRSCGSTLQDLYMSTDEDPFIYQGSTWDKVFARMTEDTTLPVPRFLHVSKVNVDYKKCFSFLARHCETLKACVIFNVRVSGCGPRLSRRSWKGKVRSDLIDINFPLGAGAVLMHHHLHYPEDDDDDDSGVEDEDEDEEALFGRAYPSMRALITEQRRHLADRCCTPSHCERGQQKTMKPLMSGRLMSRF